MTTTRFCLTHGNAEPERGFSVNKYILQHREGLHEETIVALRMIKYFISLYDDITDIPITRCLSTLGQETRNKYHLFLELKQKRKSYQESQSGTTAH